MSEMIERELGWDDEIEKDSPEFALLPEGDYDFQVIDFERALHNGSEKLPPCKKAIVQIKIEAPEGVAIIKHQLFLHSRTEGMLCTFFASIGQRKKGEKTKMNWNLVPGSKGRCKVGQHTYKDKQTGEEKGPFNDIKKFYEYETPAAPASFKAGEF